MQKVISTEKRPVKLWLDDIEEGALAQAKNLANLPFLFKHVAIMPDAHQDLIWAKITSIGPNGEKLDSSYQAFSDDEQPLIKISNGLADIVFDIGTRRYSLRYDLVHENLWQYPLSLSYQIDLEGREALIIDFYKKPVAFIERRDLADKLLEGKWHIRTKGDAVNVLFNPANLPSVINFVNSITLSGNTFNLPQGLRVERKKT